MKLGRRVGRLERPRPGDGPPLALRAPAAAVAAERGLDPAEVLAEARAVWDRAARAGVLGGAEELAAFLAAEDGGGPQELLEQADRGPAAWRG